MDATNTALLVIDMQRDFLAADGYAARAGLDVSNLQGAIAPIQTVLSAARRAGLFIVHTREGHLDDLSDCPRPKLERSRAAGAPIGSPGPLGRLLIRGERGHDFIDELRPMTGESVIDKPGYSAFHRTNLLMLLLSRSITNLLITGVTTEVCVHSTLREAVDRGFRCVTVSDACASTFPHLHAAALEMVRVEGGVFGRVATSTEVAGELQ
jgi:nicotinamidase-related amidase